MPRIAFTSSGEEPAPSLMAAARRAEELGYESVWVPETRFTRDAISTASAVATATHRVGIGTAAINPFTRGVVLTAVTFAALDELAEGRMILGIGPGSPLILEAQGIEFDRPLTRLRECVAVLRRLLAGEEVTFEGETVRVRGAGLDFAPYRSAIPIYLAVTGPRALELAGEIAAGVILNAFVSTAYTRRAIGHVRVGIERAGRAPKDVDVTGCVVTSVDADPQRARDRVRPPIATYLAKFPHIAREATVSDEELRRIRETFASGGAEAAAEHISDDVVRALTCAGTAAECRARIQECRAAGISLPILEITGGDLETTLVELADA